MVLCLAFALRTLLLIDATALRSDELYSVGKRLHSSFMSRLAMLRKDPILRSNTPCSGSGGVREQDQFHLVRQRTAGLVERYSPRARLLNLSDRMEVAMGRIPSDPVPWGDADDLEKRLVVPPLPLELSLASS